VALLASISLAVSRPATLDVDGQRVVADVAPVTAGGAAYLPLRAVGDAAGAQTSFDARTGTIVVRSRNDTVVLTVGERRANLDGRPITLAHAPFVVHGRVMVRGSDIALALDSAVRYDVRRGSIDVRTPGAVVAGAPDDSP
jgi:hypothetical protein